MWLLQLSPLVLYWVYCTAACTVLRADNQRSLGYRFLSSTVQLILLSLIGLPLWKSHRLSVDSEDSVTLAQMRSSLPALCWLYLSQSCWVESHYSLGLRVIVSAAFICHSVTWNQRLSLTFFLLIIKNTAQRSRLLWPFFQPLSSFWFRRLKWVQKLLVLCLPLLYLSSYWLITTRTNMFYLYDTSHLFPYINNLQMLANFSAFPAFRTFSLYDKKKADWRKAGEIPVADRTRCTTWLVF